ncbi:hypothetical protein [Arcobacter roscoffensis]|uniref:Uncharacterized protein n=1 Tax=Arcobacter roscoffensis TaxID=2961520 RepID=A0ABY5E1F2_9BACT|nr:hypothetical protein [Arcobacter roscoffensis]UTJ05379.1 hypothetical protein NJU99_08870 [Arcobacter roscoffensis]
MVSAIVKKIIPFNVYIYLALVISVFSFMGYQYYNVLKLEKVVSQKELLNVQIQSALDKTADALNKTLLINRSNENEIKKLEKENRKNIELLTTYYKEKLKQQKELLIIKKDIENDKKNSDAPAADVLINNTNSLWQLIQNSRSSKDCRESEDCKSESSKRVTNL